MPTILIPVTGKSVWRNVSDFYAPDLTTGLYLSYGQGSIVGEVTEEATTWPSLLEGGSPLTSVDAGRNPTIVLAGNGQKALSFGGTDRMVLAGVDLPTGFTVALKATFTGATGWPIQLEGIGNRIAAYDSGTASVSGFYHTNSGSTSSVASLSSAPMNGYYWLIFRGIPGGTMDVSLGNLRSTPVSCPVRVGSSVFSLNLGARTTNASPKSGVYEQLHVWQRKLSDTDLLGLLAT